MVRGVTPVMVVMSAVIVATAAVVTLLTRLMTSRCYGTSRTSVTLNLAGVMVIVMLVTTAAMIAMGMVVSLRGDTVIDVIMVVPAATGRAVVVEDSCFS